MICVFADDLAGAAELGGVALRHGLKAEVQLAFDASSSAEVVCVNADTRSCPLDEALERMVLTAARCRQAGVTDIYKKVDSVLRGWVIAELNALLPALDRARALLAPANPVLGRVIRDGEYWIDGLPLHETDFARDPEHPVRSASVLDMLGATGALPVRLLPVGSSLPPRGILVGEASSSADLAGWAAQLDPATLPAGAAEFFAAYLAGVGRPEQEDAGEVAHEGQTGRTLFVCGSTSSASRAFLRRAEVAGIPVRRMPAGMLTSDAVQQLLLDQWTTAAAQAVRDHPLAVVAIDQPVRPEPGMPARLSKTLAAVVKRVLALQTVDRLCVEGGATAMALIQDLDWPRLVVEQAFAPGVVGLRPVGRSGPQVVIKPGSYVWPEILFNAREPESGQPQRVGMREK